LTVLHNILNKYKTRSLSDIFINIIRLINGYFVSQRIDKGGKFLRVVGKIKLIKSNGYIEMGNKVLLYSNVKLSVYGTDHTSRLIIGKSTNIGDRTEIHCGKEVIIGENCAISWDVVIMDRDYHKLNTNENVYKPVHIEDNVWIGCRSIILKGVKVGKGSVIAAGSVVTKDVPPNTVVGGNPAKVLKKDIYWR
jgi:acetyltransferase-like isoleucine patch superfamily enzyme